jgi:short-subunit dehydrogenase
MKYVILGASSGLGRELAYSLAEKNNDLVIISRDERDLKAIKEDLEIQFKTTVQSFELDLSSLEKIQNFFSLNPNIIDEIDGILMPVGMVIKNDKIINNFENTNSIIQANLGSVIYFVSKFYPAFIKKNKGTIVGFGTIAEMFGRDENVVYSSAKRGLSSFFESLAISSLSTKLNIQFYIVGYMNTNLSYGKNILLAKGSAKELAKIVCSNFNNNYKKIYYPYWWIYINILFKITPFFLLRYLYKFIKKNNK